MTITLLHSFLPICATSALCTLIKTTALSMSLCDVLTGRGGVAGAVAGEAKTLGEDDLATDVDGLGGSF
jgi:hypothetical protein